MPQDYNQTLKLPKTDFPMRAGLPQREPAFLKAWDDDKVYKTLMEKNEGKPKYILHDGPPYANGDIHTGTAMNKILKDFIVRYKNMSGFCSPYVPGWDTHGLPIERQAIKAYGIKLQNITPVEMRKKCREFALKYMNSQREQFKRLGVMGEWDDPYLTLKPEFEAKQIEIFGEMAKKGYIYKGRKPVYWCPHDETALAEAEIEYAEDKCESIYVKFKVRDDKGKLSKYCDLDKLYFIIWTTTTWTLPANNAIALNPQEDYILAKVPSGEVYIMANVLAESTLKFGGIDSYEVLATFKGKDFEYMQAIHPFMDRDSMVVLADYVTMETGTGCVHTAAGHGADDFMTCRKYKLPVIVPVDDKGYMTEEAGKFKGLYYADSNDAILDDMKKSGALFASETIMHKYPHCWRCKEPVIFRATEQWFASVDAFKEEAVEACHDVEWIPAWGEDRIISMVRERSDWCISRQRVWGVPIPIFYCKKCGKEVVNDETIKAVSELFREKGSDSWYENSAREILPKGFKCPFCGGDEFDKEKDIMDVWFDSGSSHAAVLETRENLYSPADMYLEGADQYRGWFQSSLLTSVAARGRAPYKTVLTHGWIVDGEGKKMSKSLGNVVLPEDVIKQYGADILRLWVSSSDYRVDVRISQEMFKQISQIYLKIRNTARFILGNLDGFDPDTMSVKYEDMPELDKWAIAKLDELIEKVIKAYEDYEYHMVYHAIHNFCVIDMSNLYLDVIKDRLYCDAENGLSRRSAQTVIYKILDAVVRLISPILVFTSDEIWKAMPHGKDADGRNIVFNEMPKTNKAYKLDEKMQAKWDKLVILRDDVNSALEKARSDKMIGKPLEAKVTLYCQDDGEYDFLNNVKDELASLFIVSKVEIEKGEGGSKCEGMQGVGADISKATGEKCERCWIYSDTVGKDSEHPTLCARCAAVIKG